MNALDLQFDPIPIMQSTSEATIQIQELDQQMKQLHERMSQWYPPETFCHVNRKKQHSSRSPLISVENNRHNDEECHYKNELENLRRENNKLVLETAYVKKENTIYEKRLREESKFRESLQDELHRLAKALASSQRYTSHTDENANSVSYNTDNITFLNEQLKAYEQDFHEEHKEREKLRTRNIEIESQLEDAKESLELQQKKLLLYSQLFSNPIRTQLKLQAPPILTRPKQSSKSSSLPSTPSYCKKDKKRTVPTSLMTKSYKSNEHILEHSICSNDEIVRRRKISPTTSSSIYNFQDYESFDWINDEDVIAKGGTKHSPTSSSYLKYPPNSTSPPRYSPDNH